MKCKRCGLEYSEGEVVCRRCGFPFTDKYHSTKSEDSSAIKVISQGEKERYKKLGIISLVLSLLGLLFALTLPLEFFVIRLPTDLFRSNIFVYFFFLGIPALSIISSLSSIVIVIMIRESDHTAFKSMSVVFSVISILAIIYLIFLEISFITGTGI